MFNMKNIASGTALYLAAIWALYGSKDNGFKDSKEMKALEFIQIRKNQSQHTKPEDKAEYYKAMRQQRIDAAKADPRYKEGITKEFEEEYLKKKFVR